MNEWGRQIFGDLSEAYVARMRAALDGRSDDYSIEQARQLAAAALSKELGVLVDPRTVSLHLTQEISEDEFHELEGREHEARLNALGALPVTQAAIVACGLLP